MAIAALPTFDGSTEFAALNYFACFEPGVITVTDDAFEFAFSLKLPEAFRLIYSWQNAKGKIDVKSYHYAVLERQRFWGPRRRVKVQDVIAYKHDLAEKRRQTLNELTAYDQALGLQ